MNRWATLPWLTAVLMAAQGVSAQSANQWRLFDATDGLAEEACASVTIGAGGTVIVRHTSTNVLSILDGYTVTNIPAPSAGNRPVYESPGGQLWSVASDGLLEFRNNGWILHRVREVAETITASPSNDIPILPVRQGRVLILLPHQLLLFEVDGFQKRNVGILRRADETSLGDFQHLRHAVDGGLWIKGVNGHAKIQGPLRSLNTNTIWTETNVIPHEFKIPEFSVPPELISNPRINAMAVGLDGVMWIATQRGLLRCAPAPWQPTSHSFGEDFETKKETEKPPIPAELAHHGTWVSSLFARNGDAWLGGTDGIAWRRKDSWKLFSSTNAVGPEHVKDFAEAPDGRIWCATTNKIWEFDGMNWLPVRGGFDRINKICAAHNGILWVATDNGLYRFVRGAWVSNGPDDGLPSFIVHSVSEDKNGQVTASTSSGRAVYNPDADLDAPETIIHMQELPASFPEGATVTLSFEGQDRWKLTRATRLLYSYRLDGREWSPFQETREISFTDLSVGRHYFQTRAMDRNGNIDRYPAQLEFLVALPWYKETRIVMILTGALVVALFFAFVAFNRHRKLLRSYAVVEEEVATRTRELELANRELLHSQKMNALGSLAAGIAHDFNNILSIIKGSAQIIEENPDNKEKVHTRIERIKSMVEQGAGIVSAMLGFSSASAEQPASCDANDVVRDTMKLLGDRFLREVEIQFESEANLPQVSVTRNLVQQILLNFIFNAAESMTEKKRIVVSTSSSTRLPDGIVLKPASSSVYVAISVRDSGCGIQPEILSRIFEPFFTTKALSTRRGTGLGLSMAYELAKKLEAGIAVESTVGQGSIFTLILPVKAQQS
jgi:signal transduction histidine kinase